MSADGDKILAEVGPIRAALTDLNEKFDKILTRTDNAEASIGRSKKAIRRVRQLVVLDFVLSLVVIFVLDKQHETQSRLQAFNECLRITNTAQQENLLGRSRAAQEAAKGAERAANAFVDNVPAGERLAATQAWQTSLQAQIEAQIRYPIVLPDCHL